MTSNLQNSGNPNDDAIIVQEPIRALASYILTLTQRTGTSLEHQLHRGMEHEFSEFEKRYLYDVCMGVTRWMCKLDWILNSFYHGEYEKCIPQMKNALRIALYELLYLEDIPVDEIIGSAAHAITHLKGARAGKVAEQILTGIYDDADAIHFPDQEKDFLRYLSVVGSHPWWFAKRLVELYGEIAAMKLMLANNAKQTVSIRMNRLRASQEEFHSAMQSHHVAPVPSTVDAACISVDLLPFFSRYDEYRNGMFSSCSASDAPAIALLQPQPGDSIISLCARTSGKTLYAAERMNNTGDIVAIDRVDVIIRELERDATRLGITCLRTAIVDPITCEFPSFNKLLLDAPNSRTGTFGRAPDWKWKCSYELVLEYAEYQSRLLHHAAGFVNPGGVLVYTTSSLMPEENRDIIASFLHTHPHFTIEPADTYVPQAFATKDGFVETFPHVHHCDGSFAARLINTNK